MVTNEKQRKKLNKLYRIITGCFLKTNVSWIDYRALTKILAYRQTLFGRAISDIIIIPRTSI